MRVLLCNEIDSQLPVVIYHPCVSSIKDSQLPDGNLPPLFTASKSCPSAGFLKMQYGGLTLYRAELPKHNHIELKVTLIYQKQMFRVISSATQYINYFGWFRANVQILTS